jgi:(2Fe-2S) ferredoxin/sirohydrochlorin ferrochelatase
MSESQAERGASGGGGGGAAGAGERQEIPDAVVLLGRGGYGGEAQAELDAMLAAVRATGRYPQVEGAFLDSGGPAFPVVLRRLAGRGARRILIAPVFVPVDRSLREWLPRIVRRALKKQHLDSVVVLLAPALGEQAALGEAVVRALRDAERGADVRTDAPRDAANQWLRPPAHRYHAFLCEGPRCATLGSHELYTHLRERLAARGLTASEAPRGQGVLPVRSSCLYPCNLGPVMVVYPEGTWYGALDERAIERIVVEHFGQGHPVAAQRRFADLGAARQSPNAAAGARLGAAPEVDQSQPTVPPGRMAAD